MVDISIALSGASVSDQIRFAGMVRTKEVIKELISTSWRY